MFNTLVFFLFIIFAPIPWLITTIHLFVLKKVWDIWKYVVLVFIVVIWGVLFFFFPLSLSYYPFPAPIKIIGIVILGIALTIELLTQKALGFWRVFGKSELHQTTEKLITTGIYHYARHPRYIEHPLWFIGLGLLGYPSLLWFAVYLFLSFIVTAMIEEKELIQRYGKEYMEYRKKTPMFFL